MKKIPILPASLVPGNTLRSNMLCVLQAYAKYCAGKAAYLFYLGFMLLSAYALSAQANTELAVPLSIEPDEEGIYEFDDAFLPHFLEYPDFFKKTLLDLKEDLAQAKANGKHGIILYFSTRNCPYCEQLQDVVLGKPDIQNYLLKYFDIIGINALGDLELTDFDGQNITEQEYAKAQKMGFTPAMSFYVSDQQGNPVEALRLRGYYPPYVFRAGLDFVVSGNYQSSRFRQYLTTVKPPPEGDYSLNSNSLFQAPPYLLDRHQHKAAKRPLVVIFEQGRCHACDIFHKSYMNDPVILESLEMMDIVQLDMWADTPLITPDGQKTHARAWAEQLDLFYTPSLLFFDEQGREIFRIDSIFRMHRLQRVLRFVMDKQYLDKEPDIHWQPNTAIEILRSSE
ncbi:thioredoxin fold domain-containing protein [Candidatus Venteria ishoeyi]|uniref:thioredoxin family protein n=1 Tax=Candidatus Venteria ishoeyi TaxID=1899563 RepID=UPI0025A4D06D|nr:thioredoxin fold domain-containing protein [Candidatus Venteria ishoeyi]MDM8546666.1 thioredoxin fold domain-containing protein [Candidatus Venteria ishoeyi]